ncbi:MAG TPA: beta-ketoacyl synthase N-terminal-like domain-containing protein [Kutzneria sp.]|nr:beta-ketoacyl synthase N-terminal-like domain-containing protein [Kutzneria sp.]
MDDNAIAVIGMSCRFPGAGDPGQFWANLVEGVDSVTRYPNRQAATREYTPARGVLTGPEWFDAGYFGYSPRDARIISPQHRVFLECAVEALESAGYDPDRHPGTIGVYAGGTETYYGHLLRSQRDQIPGMTDWEILIGTATDFLVSRIAYKLGLRGPAVTVQAACATSLVAVHTATHALMSGDCDIALAGGVAIHVPQKDSPYVQGGIISADGKCRTFDAAADGTVGSDGAGLIVLKRLEDALHDGDHIHAVIRGTAINNDGADRIGYTAPSATGQASVIRDAHEIAGVDPDTITLIEAHGTATPLGDPIEITALTEAFRDGTDRVGYCAIGSVKTNIGHTDAAAGIAGLIKAVLAVEHGIIPASLHFTSPNPRIPFEGSPFRVAARTEKWETDGIPRRAGVSSFGIGGTNAHVIVEQPPVSTPSRAEDDQLIVLSARTPEALDALAAEIQNGASNADIAWTLQVGRREFPYRLYAIVASDGDIVEALANAVRNTEPAGRVALEGDVLGLDLAQIGELWLRGADIPWDRLHRGRRQRVPLPTYPFERQRYIVEAPSVEEIVPQQRESVDSRQPTAELTAQIFAKMLDLPEVGPDDDFFDLGGDSLVGTYLLGEIHDALGVDLELESLYDAPTPQALAELVDQGRS